MKLINKISLVTGAGQGIGKAIAELLAKEGSTVIICDISLDRANKAVEEIIKNGGKAAAVCSDVSSSEDVNSMFKFIEENYGGLDILVNNAGISPKQRFEDITAEDWDKVLGVNLKGTFLCTQNAFRLMKIKGSGKIINIASIAGQNGGTVASPHYVSSKAGIIGFTKAMALLGGPHNINVNAIAPGRIVTELFYKDIDPEKNNEVISRIPLGHPGEPKDIAEAVLFLASDSSRYMTGACLNVNGGLLF